MRNAGLEETQAGIKIAGRNINNLRYADDTTLMAESEEELKSLLTKVKEESEKAGLKFNIKKKTLRSCIQSHHFMAYNRWGNNENSERFYFLRGSKITADGDCSHEIKMLTPWKKTMTNLDVVLKRRNVTLLIKVLIVKAMVFPVVM